MLHQVVRGDIYYRSIQLPHTLTLPRSTLGRSVPRVSWKWNSVIQMCDITITQLRHATVRLYKAHTGVLRAVQ